MNETTKSRLATFAYVFLVVGGMYGTYTKNSDYDESKNDTRREITMEITKANPTFSIVDPEKQTVV
jgi:hypothetical protein